MLDLVVKSGKVVLPHVGVIDAEIGVESGKIKIIAKNIEAKAESTINAKDCIVTPGIVDSHFHAGIYRPLAQDAKSESSSAASGGVTTILSYFRSGKNYLNSSEDYSQLFPKVLEQSKNSFKVDYGYNLAPIKKEHINEIDELVDKYGVTTFKFYMFYKGLNLKSEISGISVEKEYLLSDDKYDLGHLWNIMKAVQQKKEKSARLSIHAEEYELIRIFMERARKEYSDGKVNAMQAYSMARPPESEKVAIREAATMAQLLGCPINILHVSSKLAIETIAEIKKQNTDIDLMAEVTASHLSLTNDLINGIAGKVNPPIRSNDDKEALWKAVREGFVDTIASDHACLTKEQKGSELWSAENGYGATELMVPGVLSEGFFKRDIPLEKLITMLTFSPAKFHGVSGRKGNLMIGYDADIAIIDMKKEKRVKSSDLHSAQDFTPFENINLKGWPRTTILRGNVVYNEGEVYDGFKGEYLKRPL